MDFPKKQQQCLIPKYLLDYATELQDSHPDPTAEWSGGSGGSPIEAGTGIEITGDETKTISVDDTVAMKTDIPDVSDFITENEVDTKLEDYELKSDAFSGSYNDLTDKPDLSIYAESANLASVATTGDYDDLSNKPTIPTVNNNTITITQGGVTKGTFTLNQSSDSTIALDAGGGSSYTAGTGIDITNDTISVDNTVAMKTDIPEGTEVIDITYVNNSYVSGTLSQADSDKIRDNKYNIIIKYHQQQESQYETYHFDSDYSSIYYFVPRMQYIGSSVGPNYHKLCVDIFNNTYWWIFIDVDYRDRYVTLSTAQNITSSKTFLGNKKLWFKQDQSNDVLGFTALDLNGQEYGNLQINARSMKIDNITSTKDFVSLGNYKESSVSGARAEVGVRVQENKTGSTNPASKNYIYPRNFTNLPSTSDTFYIPLSVNGNYADNAGNISINIPTVPTTATSTSSSTSTSTVTPSTITLTFTYSDDTTEDVTLMTNVQVATTTTTTTTTTLS